MTNCEVCGKRTDELVYSIVEGVKLQACGNCAGFGRFAGSVKKEAYEQKEAGKIGKEEPEEESVVSNFPELLKKKRESLGLSQKDFAMKINEKESFIEHVENGKASLSIGTAKKFERILHMRLVEKQKITYLANKAEKSRALTIGDLLGKK